jgi:hypothetical protein
MARLPSRGQRCRTGRPTGVSYGPPAGPGNRNNARSRGREKLHYLNAAPVNAIADRWISQYDRERVRALADLKTALEQEPMTSNEPGSLVLENVSQGWPAILANLKTLLETGDTLPASQDTAQDTVRQEEKSLQP